MRCGVGATARYEVAEDDRTVVHEDPLAAVPMSPRTQAKRRTALSRVMRARDDRIPFTTLATSPSSRQLQRAGSRTSLGMGRSPTAASSALAARNAMREVQHGLKGNPALRPRHALMDPPPAAVAALSSPDRAVEQSVVAAVHAARAHGVVCEPLAMGLVRNRQHVLSLRCDQRVKPVARTLALTVGATPCLVPRTPRVLHDVCRGYGIGDKVAAVLARSDFDKQLVEVDLAHNRLSSRAAKALVERIPPSHLRKLDLSVNRVGHAGAAALGQLLKVPHRPSPFPSPATM